MTDALIPQPGLSELERRALRSSLSDRRERLAALPTAALGPRVASLLAEVDAALDRLEGPDFGACTRCDGHVEADRLRANPLTTVCLDCLSEPERRALERDLELASRVQASLLPPWDFSSGDWSGHFLYQPHGAVSGDYVDVLAPGGPNDDLLVMVGDVSGKGVAAALLMSHLHAVFRATAGSCLVEMVERANRLLCAASPTGAFATLVAARLQPDGEVELCTAGHTSPIVVAASGITELPADSMPIGLFSDAPFATRRLRLAPGDALVLYTDGLTESTSADGVELGGEGVRAALAAASWRTPAELVRTASAAALGFHRHDDLTVLAVTRRSAN
ncbi:MAG TPA: SpoIIE family protein phosphatase [Thermoanaerobaculales bacterium]|nr:SpoIIE family protein phosphatase [Thermoanaerobaculales bacterium]HPA80349.1 SpoIIE family protein phosphatase [Thermoanaerobaculales bacterium]HQL29044.1 SpoIIE family protein phosphatase [Thermoanaerobaculales bacterium]HQN97036.1 SpoIIE family protein phosphatase [Thermoanaerobaculales bacterium]HQP42020.1 SpoIIE family protein phosphatase [Thermoanaerobaculales bacterium]